MCFNEIVSLQEKLTKDTFKKNWFIKYCLPSLKKMTTFSLIGSEEQHFSFSK